jgi:hypothetical protein
MCVDNLHQQEQHSSYALTCLLSYGRPSGTTEWRREHGRQSPNKPTLPDESRAASIVPPPRHAAEASLGAQNACESAGSVAWHGAINYPQLCAQQEVRLETGRRGNASAKEQIASSGPTGASERAARSVKLDDTEGDNTSWLGPPPAVLRAKPSDRPL